MNKIFILFFIVPIIREINAQTPAEVINKWADEDQWKHAHIGFALHDVASGNLVAGYNHDKSFVPASSLKILTTFAGMELLGRDFKYQTILAWDGSLQDSVLTGNIHIIGSGDPSLASKRFEEKLNFSELPNYIADKIADKGIKKITGALICDESIFNSSPIAPTWQWDDLGSGYACGAWGLNVNENEYEIWYDSDDVPGQQANIITVTPDIPNLLLNSDVSIGEENTRDNAYIWGGPNIYEKEITGTIPRSRQPFKVKGAIPNPPRLLAEAVQHSLLIRNIQLDSIVIRSFPETKKELFALDTLRSAPLDELIRQANHHSINLYCEAFLKTIGSRLGNSGSGSEGIKVINQYMKDNGFDVTPLNLEDGSGLSARNYISPFLLSSFLAKFTLRYSPENTVYLLPEAGSEGTVRRLLKNSAAKGKVWMKSGSMNKIISYTGLIKSKLNKWYSFSIMINGYNQTPASARKAIEQLISNLYTSL